MPARLRTLGIVLAAALSTSIAGAVDFDSVDFFRAINVDNDGAVARMLAAGLDPNQLDPRGQPALIVAMGAIVLVLVLAVMLPIVTMNQLIR